MADMPEKKAPAKKASAKKASSATKAAASAKKAATSAKKAAGAKKASSSKRAATNGPTHEEIARRAYEIHEREGGSHEENWLRAERELSGA